MLSFSFAISAAVAGAAAGVCPVVVGDDAAALLCGAVVVGGSGAVVVTGAGTSAAGGPGCGSCCDVDIDAPVMTHHSASVTAAAAITLIKARSMAVSKVRPLVTEVMRKVEVSMSNHTIAPDDRLVAVCRRFSQRYTSRKICDPYGLTGSARSLQAHHNGS